MLRHLQSGKPPRLGVSNSLTSHQSARPPRLGVSNSLTPHQSARPPRLGVSNSHASPVGLAAPSRCLQLPHASPVRQSPPRSGLSGRTSTLTGSPLRLQLPHQSGSHRLAPASPAGPTLSPAHRPVSNSLTSQAALSPAHRLSPTPHHSAIIARLLC
ncbi:hypothetical protein Syun_025291 [Stephania yunnanensis]|uniref:Uncharacterized protein n=1 Tax=Stephania yunnanensis TaxID=152371 RepID=A0AAP0ERX9_9MAGN